ncbi:VOC family protein [Otoolea muris]|uniref:VOC family protein n=1 Tax=Otoolea muris TaxID=2941515 RepID=UPI00203F7192|nr:VOC family protein [Otoolea muris]
MRIHHIGYAVSDMKRSIEKFEILGYQRYTQVIRDTARNIQICFMENGPYRVELVSVLDGRGLPSPVDGWLKNNGSSPYHICYECSDMREAVMQLRKEKFKPICTPAGAIAFDNRKVVFLMSVHAGLVELLEAQSSDSNSQEGKDSVVYS